MTGPTPKPGRLPRVERLLSAFLFLVATATAASLPQLNNASADTRLTTGPAGGAPAGRDDNHRPSDVEIVRFAHVRIAIHTTTDAHTLGEQLWLYTQAAQALASCASPARPPLRHRPPAPPPPPSPQQQQATAAHGSCSFLELGGPGLVAFSLAKLLPQLPVALLPGCARLANISAAMNRGARHNLRLIADDEPRLDLDDLLPDDSTSPPPALYGNAGAAAAHAAAVVVQLNMYDELERADRRLARLGAVRGLLARRPGAVHAMLLLLPAAGAASAGDAAAAANEAADTGANTGGTSAVDAEVARLLRDATAAGFQVLVGGFDGAPLPDPTALAAFAAAAIGAGSAAAAAVATGYAPAEARRGPAAAARERRGLIGLYIARQRSPPPRLHIMAPLRAKANTTSRSSSPAAAAAAGAGNATSVVSRDADAAALLAAFCANLAATAAAVGLRGLHVAGWTVTDPRVDHPLPRTQKLTVLRRALLRVPPTDVVVALDSLDSLAQLPAEAVLQRYLDAGSPVFRASTEAGCWPPEFAPWCGLYELNPVARLENRYLNSGGVIGRSIVLARFLYDAVAFLEGKLSPASWIPSSCTGLGASDQGLLACPYLFGNRYSLSLDYDSTFFYSVFIAAQHLAPTVAEAADAEEKPEKAKETEKNEESGEAKEGGAPGSARGGVSRRRLQQGLQQHQQQQQQQQGTRAGVRGWFDSRTNVTPAFLHCNGGNGRQSLDRLRRGILPDGGRPPKQAYSFLMDGRHVRYGDLCQ